MQPQPAIPTDEMLSAYLDGDLNVAQCAEVDRALAASDELRRTLAELESLRAALRALPAVKPSAGFHARVMQAVAAAQAAESPSLSAEPRVTNKPTPPAAWHAPLIGILSAAAVAASLALLLAAPWRFGEDDTNLARAPQTPPPAVRHPAPNVETQLEVAEDRVIREQKEKQFAPAESPGLGRANAAPEEAAAAPANAYAAPAPPGLPVEEKLTFDAQPTNKPQAGLGGGSAGGIPAPGVIADKAAEAKFRAEREAQNRRAAIARGAPAGLGKSEDGRFGALQRDQQVERHVADATLVTIEVQTTADAYRFDDLATALADARFTFDAAKDQAERAAGDFKLKKLDALRQRAVAQAAAKRAAPVAAPLDVVYLEGPAEDIAAALAAWKKSPAGSAASIDGLAALEPQTRRKTAANLALADRPLAEGDRFEGAAPPKPADAAAPGIAPVPLAARGLKGPAAPAAPQAFAAEANANDELAAPRTLALRLPADESPLLDELSKGTGDAATDRQAQTSLPSGWVRVLIVVRPATR